MSAAEIDFDAEYGFVEGTTRLSAAELNRRFLSLHQRINAIAVKGEGYDSLIEQGTGAALRRINEGVAPLLAALFEQIAAAETALGLLESQISGGITAAQIKTGAIPNVTATNIQDALVEIANDLAAGDQQTAANAAGFGFRDLLLSGF